MARFTRLDDARVDQAVLAHLDCIQAAVLRRIKPQALLLAGSFGRGEGSVGVNGTGLHFYSDYEVCLISADPRSRWLIDRIIHDLAGQIPVDVSLFWNTPGRIHNNRSRNLSFGKAQSTIGMYELKAGSFTFCGNFDLTTNQIDPAKIPVSEGVRLICNRMMEVIEAWRRDPSPEAVRMPTAKLVLACGDALLLHAGCYHYSYYERSQRFARHYDRLFAPILDTEYQEFYRRAAEDKLNPDAREMRDSAAALSAASKASEKVLRLLTGTDGGDCAEIAVQCAGAIPLLYCTGLTPGLDIAYERMILALRAFRAKRRLYWGDIPRVKKPLSPFQALYAAIPALFWGLPMAGPADAAALETSARWSRWALPDARADRPLELTQRLLEMWHIFG